MRTKKELKHLIDVASRRIEADLVIENAKIIDVFNATVVEGDVAIANSTIVGIGPYKAKNRIDAKNKYLAPGFIDAHVHIESSLVDAASFEQLVVPRGTTTVIADPHEICNVTALDGFDFMLKSSKNLALSIFFMVPSCVPSSPFESSGASLDAKAISKRIGHKRVLGLGEMMDIVGTIEAYDYVISKLLVAEKANKIIDGHAPQLAAFDLNAFAVAGVRTDHESTTAEELVDKLQRGMYVMLREGSATKDLKNLLAAVNKTNSRYCLFCTDDRQPISILEEGHIDNHLRIATKAGLDPIEAIRIATINASECYNLKDRGAIASGRRADLVLLKDLEEFEVDKVFCGGKEYIKPKERKLTHIPKKVLSKVNIGDFSKEKLNLKLKKNTVRVIEIIKNSIITNSVIAEVTVDNNGLYQNDETNDIIKLAVIERHRNSGNVGLALLKGLNLKNGSIATTIAHDSHNVIVVGDNDLDMSVAVNHLVKIKGGIVIVQNNEVIADLSLPIAGLMTNQSPYYVKEKLELLHSKGVELLSLDSATDPFTILSFMALPVIPHLKVTDMGLFDVDNNKFVELEV